MIVSFPAFVLMIGITRLELPFVIQAYGPKDFFD
jgi:hypothetical protein